MIRGAALVCWLLLIALGCGLPPPTRPDVGAWVADLLMGRWDGTSPWVVAEFQWMGLWPALVGLLIRSDWRARVPAWPFVLASFGLGCYALLPWFVLRQDPRGVSTGGWLGRPVWPVTLTAIAVALLVWAAATGDIRELGYAVAHEGFVWTMTFDFVAFWLLSIAESRARTRGTPWQWTLVPLVGLGVFLALESRIGDSAGTNTR